MADRLSIIIPVHNEGAHFPALWSDLCGQIHCAFTACVVYDSEDDNTLPVARQIRWGKDQNLRLLRNNVRPGVAGAILAGFCAVATGPVLVVMADRSDDLKQVDDMLDLYREGYDVVVGSRYMPGGKTIDGPFLKQSLSRMAGLSLHWLRGIPTHDATNAFKLYDREMLRSFSIESQAGFELNLELTVKAFLGGYRIAQVPTTWRERTEGKSRFRLWAWLPKYLRWYFYAFRPKGRPPKTPRQADSGQTR